jgi:integrase
VGHDDHPQPPVQFAVNTGLRRGELFQLTWADVGSANNTLTVRGGSAQSGQTRHVGPYEVARQVFANLRRDSNSEGWIFPGEGGKARTMIHTSWRASIKAAEITEFRIRDQRHHFVSRLVMAGVDIKTVRELLGYSELEKTLRYDHLSRDLKLEAVKRLNV